MKLKQILFVATLISSLAVGQRVLADDTAEQLRLLREQIQALDQKVRELERRRDLETDTAAKPSVPAPVILAGTGGLSVTSADSNFVFQLRGVLQVDNRTFFNDAGAQGNDTFLLRRARPIFQGTLFKEFDFLFVPEFGGSSVSIVDAYLNYRYRPWLQLRGGKFKVPFGLEQLQSDPATAFNERALPTALGPNRDIGFQIWGDVAGGRLSYALGVFNGVGDGRSSGNADFEDHREVAARLFAQPFKQSNQAALRGVGLGVAGTWGTVSSNATGLPATTGGTLAGYATDGQQQFFAYHPTNGAVAANGTHWRVSPQGYYYWGPFSLLGEYAISQQRVTAAGTSADLRHTAWQVTAGWFLTGEDASFSGVTPKRPFNPGAGQWGAWQLVARYAELDIDDDAFPTFANAASSASGVQSWAVGLNWYLNKALRVNTSFSRTTFDGGGGGAGVPGIVTRQPEEVLFTRVQLAF